MSTLSVYPAAHLKLHVSREEVRTGVPASLLKRALASAEQAAATAVFLLTVGLVVFALMQISETGTVIASYGDACTLLPKLFPVL